MKYPLKVKSNTWLHFIPKMVTEVLYVKGSAERLLSFSKYLIKEDKIVPLRIDDSQIVMAAATEMAQEALRVIAMAYVELPPGIDKLDEKVIRNDLVFAGLAGMADPPREEAKEAIKRCKQAGIKVVMITGDNKITAESIARQLELSPGRAITGIELGKMSDEESVQ